MIAVLIMYILTFVILMLTGILCIAHHSKFPDTNVGYHVLWAMKNKELWILANKVSGYLCIITATVQFLILPIVFYLLNINTQIQILIYLLETISSVFIIIVLPEKILKQFHPGYFID